MTVLTRTIQQGRWTLNDLHSVFTWARMKFKPAKSRSLVIKKGKPQRTIFKTGGTPIPTVHEKPIKCLGKWFDITGGDKNSIEEMIQQAETWLRGVDKSGLPGSCKAWCYQHGILPRLAWPMFIYSIPITTIELLERKISSFLRRWLNLPKSLSSIALYSRGNMLQLPMTSVLEEFKVTKVRQAIMLRDNRDEKVRSAGIDLNTGRKWLAQNALEEAEARLRHSDIVGTVTHGRLGLGIITRSQWRTATDSQRREMVQKEVRQQEEETRKTKAVSLKTQGCWLRWEGIRGKKMSWSEMWKTEPHRLKFAIASVYDTLPSPTNLATWKLIDDPSCAGCGKRATLEHILCWCQRALADGKYNWRHDQIFAVFAGGIDKARLRCTTASSAPNFIRFVKPSGNGSKTQKKGNNVFSGILAMASDWQLLVDLKKQLRFPEDIAVTNYRPDMVLFSKKSRVCVLIELTVPWEERIEEAHERKMAKYAELVEQCRTRAWKTWCFPIKVGCRGFPSNTTWRALKMLGVIGKKRKEIIAHADKAAEAGSLWIWKRRNDKNKPEVRDVNPQATQPIDTLTMEESAQQRRNSQGYTCSLCHCDEHATLSTHDVQED